MKIVVLKFGGTSVGTVDRIKKVANIIISYVKKNTKINLIAPATPENILNSIIK